MTNEMTFMGQLPVEIGNGCEEQEQTVKKRPDF